jgi:SAM-dependent methyltransferase
MVLAHNPAERADYYGEHAWHPLRVESITEQLREICYSGYRDVLEIGVGNGFLTHCLRFFPEIHHTTLDIDASLHPDRVGSVTNMPFADQQFDVVLCCQVLEHLPFFQFLPALREIRRVTRHKVILSLPDKRRRFGLAACLARAGWLTWELNMPRWKHARRTLPDDDEHRWEIGCKGTLGRDVVRKIREAGFTIERQYRLHGHEWHTFFILTPP